MSKVNKQKRGRAYAESVKHHVLLAQSQMLRLDADTRAADASTGKMNADLSFVEIKLGEHRAEIENLTAMLKELDPEIEKLRKTIALRQEVVRRLSSQVLEMGNVIGVTASKLGIDLSNVEPATEDADVPVAEVTEKSEAAQLEEATP